ncbi:hypothetical protein C2W62_46630, partial [Candidatus Entotheonella serta]
DHSHETSYDEHLTHISQIYQWENDRISLELEVHWDGAKDILVLLNSCDRFQRDSLPPIIDNSADSFQPRHDEKNVDVSRAGFSRDERAKHNKP